MKRITAQPHCWAARQPLLLLAVILAGACRAHRIIPVAAIIPGLGGLFGSDEKESDRQMPPPRSGQDYPQQRPPKRPPPPPPRSGQQQKTEQENASQGNPQSGDASVETEEHQTQQKQPPPPPPRQVQQQQEQQRLLEEQQNEEQIWDPYNQFSGLPPPGWGGLPAPDGTWGMPPPQGDWMQQAEMDGFQNMQREIEDRIARELDLWNEIHNLTASLATSEQREDLHMRQLDMLTERVMETEAAAASERNELMELRANCTEMGRAIAVLQDEVEEWKNRCTTLHEQRDQDKERFKEVQETLKARDFEVEELASSIEKSRLGKEREKYLSDRRKKKKGGFFSWLFGVGRDDTDDDEEQLQELAKSTLLRALQRERNNVDELEAALFTLQQNNSAISEMVESRDILISELNDRVAVFEEDKLVLKAALRQLQKEMREEAPRTQKLIHDLQVANEEIINLNEEIQSLISTHQGEVSMLQQAIVQKQAAINETESNMTMIGTYVDTLEERLATFAIARREIEIREQRCKEIEDCSGVAEHERDIIKQKMEEMAVEQEDLKNLLDELVQERSAFRTENEAIAAERDKLREGEIGLKEAMASLEQDVLHLDRVAHEWKSKVTDIEMQLEEESERARHAQEYCDELAAKLEEAASRVAHEESLAVTDDVENKAAQSTGSETTPEPANVIGNDPVVPIPPLLLPRSERPPNLRRDISTDNRRTATPNLQNPSVFSVLKFFTRNKSDTSTTGRDGRPQSPVSTSQQGLAPPIRGSPLDRKNIPLRSLRKQVSKRTGLHGVFTPSSRQLLQPPPRKPSPRQDSAVEPET